MGQEGERGEGKGRRKREAEKLDGWYMNGDPYVQRCLLVPLRRIHVQLCGVVISDLIIELNRGYLALWSNVG